MKYFSTPSGGKKANLDEKRRSQEGRNRRWRNLHFQSLFQPPQPRSSIGTLNAFHVPAMLQQKKDRIDEWKPAHFRKWIRQLIHSDNSGQPRRNALCRKGRMNWKYSKKIEKKTILKETSTPPVHNNRSCGTHCEKAKAKKKNYRKWMNGSSYLRKTRSGFESRKCRGRKQRTARSWVKKSVEVTIFWLSLARNSNDQNIPWIPIGTEGGPTGNSLRRKETLEK